jgi:hypothetical protein
VRDVRADRQIDSKRRARRLLIVLGEPFPDFGGRGAHDRVLGGVVGRGPAERLDADRPFLQLVLSS